MQFTAAPKTQPIEISLNFGVGIGGKIDIGGVGVDVHGKLYYDITDVTTNVPTQSFSLAAEANLANLLTAGASYTGTINAATRQRLANDGYAGIKVGGQVLGWSSIPNNDDFVVDVTVGAFVGVGAEVSLKINLSKLLK